jgi:Na+-driven multidrug efflux pump
MALLFLLSEEILLFLGQEPSVAYNSERSALYCLPGLAFYLLADFLRCIQMSTGVYQPYSAIIAVTLAWGLLLSYLLQDSPEAGPFLLINLTFGLLLALSLASMRWCCPWLDLLTLPQLDSLKDGHFLQYSKEVLWMSSSQLLDLLCYEVNALLVGSLHDNYQTAAHLAIANLVNIVYSNAVGIANSAMAVLSTQIGQARVQGIRNTFVYIQAMAFLSSLLFTVLLSSPGNQLALGQFYSDKPEISHYFAVCLRIYVFYCIVDFWQYQACFFIKGFGFARTVTTLAFVIYYLIAIPLSAVLVYYFGWGVAGVWSGFGVGMVLMFFAGHYFLYQLDWEKVIHSRRQEILN